MAAITTRATAGGGATVKGSPLTNAELDTNFININTDLVDTLGNISTSTNIGTWASTGSYSVGGQETGPTGIFFKPDGTVMYITGTSGDDVTQYSLSVPWSLSSTITHQGQSAALGDTSPSSIFFSSDGTKLFLVGQTNDTVYEYSLGTAWSVLGTVTLSNSFSIAAQDTTPQGIFFSSDGTKMFMVGSTNDTIYQYSLTTPWSLAAGNITYSNISFSVAQYDTTPTGIDFDSTGTRMWICGDTKDRIFEFLLGTPWSLSGTITFIGSQYIGNLEASITDIWVEVDQNKAYIIGTSTDAVYQLDITASGAYNFKNRNAWFGTGDFSGRLDTAGSFTVGGSALFYSTAQVNSTLTAAAAFTASSTTSAINIGTSQSTGTLILGGTAQTANITLGRATTASQITDIQSAALTSGNTKTINIGTAGLSGSTTNINIGSVVSGALGSTTVSTPVLNLSTGSSGINLSNGTTVTAITSTARGTGYTSYPTVTISAPTTSGGIQATASVLLNLASATLVSGGTGYSVNDVLTFSGVTGTAPTIRVDTVSGGIITAFTITGFGAGAVQTPLPTNPVSVTGGTGTGATFNASWNTGNFTITNAGSGYVEQPTVTFSGGGGSGATAYASVGTGPVIRSIASQFIFATTSGDGLRISDSGTTNVNYTKIQGNSTGGNVLYGAGGSDSNIGVAVSSFGTGSVSFRTNNAAQEQMRVSHTASAVNYVQVTGGSTGNSPLISAQGSDTSIALAYTSKGTGNLNFFTNAAAARHLQVTHVAGTLVNFVSVSGAATNTAPIVAAAGSDTNIDLTLTPKGTGKVVITNGIQGGTF